MQYKQIGEVITKINGVLGKQETKVQKKLFKFAEKLKPYQEDYLEKLEELRLDNASTGDNDVLLLDDKGNYKYNKEGLKKLNEQVKSLNEQEFIFTKIAVVNPQGLENFDFLADWVTGVEFVKQEEEEL